MKIKKSKTVRYVEEIGPLDATMRLPMSGRPANRVETICDACGDRITDEWFIAGFKTGERNLKLHERCAPAAPAECTFTSSARCANNPIKR